MLHWSICVRLLNCSDVWVRLPRVECRGWHKQGGYGCNKILYMPRIALLSQHECEHDAARFNYGGVCDACVIHRLKVLLCSLTPPWFAVLDAILFCRKKGFVALANMANNALNQAHVGAGSAIELAIAVCKHCESPR